MQDLRCEIPGDKRHGILQQTPQRRSDFEQEVRYIASFIGKYVEADAHVKEIIEQYVSGNGLRKEKHSAVVLWWGIPA